MIDRTAAINNGTGVLFDGGLSGLLNNSLMTGNTTGISAINGASLLSYKNNSINLNNGTDGVPTGALTPE